MADPTRVEHASDMYTKAARSIASSGFLSLLKEYTTEIEAGQKRHCHHHTNTQTKLSMPTKPPTRPHSDLALFCNPSLVCVASWSRFLTVATSRTPRHRF